MVIMANVMIPSVAEHVVIMVFLLLPVVLVEAVVLEQRHLLKVVEALKLSLLANLRSTFVGLPLGYLFAWLGLIPVGLFAALLPENVSSPISRILENMVAHGGTVPNKYDEVAFYLGTLLVMIPYYFVTLRVERKVIVKRNPSLDTPRLWGTVYLMNVSTYSLLALPVIAGAIRAGRRLAASGVMES